MKATFEQQTRDIVREMRNELNERNFGGDLHKARCVLDKIKSANEYFLSKLENFSGKSNSDYDGEVVIANDHFVLNNVIEQQEESKFDGGGGGGGITPPVAETATANETKGLKISWGNCSWRKHSSDPTLFFNPVYDIHKHVGNVVLRGYI